MKSKFGLHVIQYPSGKWGFVGSVPAELSYVTKQGGSISAANIEKQLRLPANKRIIKSRAWLTKEAAVEEANERGYEVSNA